jgi:hypothetical protein
MVFFLKYPILNNKNTSASGAFKKIYPGPPLAHASGLFTRKMAFPETRVPPFEKGGPGGISEDLLKNPPQSPFSRGGRPFH